LVDLFPRRAPRRAEESTAVRFVRANGLVLHYLLEGPDAPAPLVFVNPLGCDFRVWSEVASILKPEFRVVAYDKRGHGLSEPGPDRCEMADYARDLAALLDAIEIRRAVIIGISIGGVIAQELYRQRPELVAALVLCDTSAKVGTDQSWDERIAAVGRGGVEAVAGPILERWFTPEFRAGRAAEFAGFGAMLTRAPKQGYLAACGALKRADLRPYLGLIETPTLCLVGDQDGTTPPALVKEMAALIKGSRFEIIEGAGHLPNVEKPAAVARLIAEHVTRTTL
jgi:3-oxoadipate enol-lactonase